MSDKEPRKTNAEKKKAEGPSSLAVRPSDYARDVERMIDDFGGRFGSLFIPPLPGAWGAPRHLLPTLPNLGHPYADLIDSGKEYRVVADVPGIPKEKLNITVTDWDITIEGEANTDFHEEKEGYVRRERGYSRVARRISFPQEVVADKAEASLRDGVLEVKLPKKRATTAKGHKISVK